jgi:ATP-dependent DNA ligase
MIDIHPTNPSMNSIGKSFPTVVINGLMYTIMKSSDVIETKSKTGVKSWRGYVVRSPMGEYSLTSSWFNENAKTGKRSVEQFATPYPVTQKNVGRANQTDVITQAYLEFESMVKKELDKRNSVRPLPMLAQKFSERAKYIQYPAAVQPKLNGMRMLFDGETGWSRGGKDIIAECIAHLTPNVADVLAGGILDGELILPNNVLLQETMKAAKKYRAGVSDKLLYCVYDMIDTTGTVPFEVRSATLKQMVEEINNPQIIFVETRIVNSVDEVKAAHKDFTAQKYEGTMIRNLDSTYDVNQRSNGLQKYKDFVDDEFTIVDVIEGDGSFKGCAIFVCETHNGQNRFNCTPEGTTKARKELFESRESLIGNFLTIKYQELSSDSIPLFPVGIDVRKKEDFS